MTYERYQNGGPRSAGSALSSSEIQSDVNDIRGEISKTFEAISEKLEPKEVFGKLIDQPVKDFIESSALSGADHFTFPGRAWRS